VKSGRREWKGCRETSANQHKPAVLGQPSSRHTEQIEAPGPEPVHFELFDVRGRMLAWGSVLGARTSAADPGSTGGVRSAAGTRRLRVAEGVPSDCQRVFLVRFRGRSANRARRSWDGAGLQAAEASRGKWAFLR
jgi:hypothetical protein